MQSRCALRTGGEGHSQAGHVSRSRPPTTRAQPARPHLDAVAASLAYVRRAYRCAEADALAISARAGLPRRAVCARSAPRRGRVHGRRAPARRRRPRRRAARSRRAEKPVKVGIDLGGATQFGRREANREVREARWTSQADIEVRGVPPERERSCPPCWRAASRRQPLRCLARAAARARRLSSPRSAQRPAPCRDRRRQRRAGAVAACRA
jgi:hypothetical protein